MKVFKIQFRSTLSSIEPVQTSTIIAESSNEAIGIFYSTRNKDWFDIETVSTVDVDQKGEIK